MNIITGYIQSRNERREQAKREHEQRQCEQHRLEHDKDIAERAKHTNERNARQFAKHDLLKREADLINDANTTVRHIIETEHELGELGTLARIAEHGLLDCVE